jgi:tetratricopeptide (TPR) repeat protein
MHKQLLIIIFSLLPLTDFAQIKDNTICRDLYNGQKFSEAYECYSKEENEIFSVYMSAYLAKFLGYKKEYKHWFKRLTSDAFNTSETFYYAAHLYPANSKKFLKALDKGLKVFENDTLLLTEKVNFFIEIEEYEKGLPLLEQLIKLKTNDLEIYLVTANIYSWLHKNQMAIPYYEKVLEIEIENYDANYGLGLIYFNQAANIVEEANQVEDHDEFERLDREGVSLMNMALPFLEIAFFQTPADTNLKSALLTCYLRLHMNEKYKALKAS